MAYFYVWYWQYSIVFPITLIIVLVLYFCCRVCLASEEREQRQTRRRRQNRQNQQTATSNQPQVYTITTVVVPDQSPPYKTPTPAPDDLPPSYDEALVLASVKVQDEQSQQHTTTPTSATPPPATMTT